MASEDESDNDDVEKIEATAASEASSAEASNSSPEKSANGPKTPTVQRINRRARPGLRRMNTSEAAESHGSIRHLESKPPLTRALSGDGMTSRSSRSPMGGNDNRRTQMNQRAMSTRTFGTAGRGMGRPGLSGGRGMGMAQKSMSSRFLDSMASTRALFSLDDAEDDNPSMITYMGRDVKASDYFDDDWIEDALDEEARVKNALTGLGAMNRRQSKMNTAPNMQRLSQQPIKKNSLMQDNSLVSNASDTDDNDNPATKEDDTDGDIDTDGDLGETSESESEVEEEMEPMEEDDSKKIPQPRAQKAQPRRVRPVRAKSSDPSAMIQTGRRTGDSGPNTPSSSRRSAPPTRGVGRSKTFDGRKTSEVLPRRRKAKSTLNRTSSTEECAKKSRSALTESFNHFLANMGNMDFGNPSYMNISPMLQEPREPPRMPRTKKKKEQFRKLNYTADDIQDVLCDDTDTFQRLKRVLTKKGAVTNGVLQQRLHIFLKKAKDRNSKAAKKKREEEAAERGEDLDDSEHTRNESVNHADWQAMSMMDMFAKSVRKLAVTSNHDSMNDSSNVSATQTPPPKPLFPEGAKPWSDEPKPWSEEPKSSSEEPKPWSEESRTTGEDRWKRRALPRQQALLAKKKAMLNISKSSSSSLKVSQHSVGHSIGMMSVSEDDEESSEEEEVVDMEDMDKSGESGGFNALDVSNMSGATGMDASRLSTGMDVSRMSTGMDTSRMSTGMDTSQISTDSDVGASDISSKKPSPTKMKPNRQKSLSRRKGSRQGTRSRRSGSRDSTSPRKMPSRALSNESVPEVIVEDHDQHAQRQSTSKSDESPEQTPIAVLNVNESQELKPSEKDDAKASEKETSPELLVGWSH